jgi:hypothetical protein
MMKQFWRTPSEWPNDPPGYVFLARAFDEIGVAMFGEKWSMKDEKTEQEVEPVDLDADDLALAETQDEHEAMWVAIKAAIVRGCAEGRLISAVRPKEGGNTEELDKGIWHSEHLDQRFYRCEMSPASPFKKGRRPETHWIFLQRQSLGQYLAVHPHNRAPTPNHLSPYLKAMLVVAKSMQITPQNQPKKELVVDEIKRTWSGPALSDKLVKAMATLIREPESQLGRAKKKN